MSKHFKSKKNRKVQSLREILRKLEKLGATDIQVIESDSFWAEDYKRISGGEPFPIVAFDYSISENHGWWHYIILKERKRVVWSSDDASRWEKAEAIPLTKKIFG